MFELQTIRIDHHTDHEVSIGLAQVGGGDTNEDFEGNNEEFGEHLDHGLVIKGLILEMESNTPDRSVLAEDVRDNVLHECLGLTRDARDGLPYGLSERERE